jgi:exosortase A
VSASIPRSRIALLATLALLVIAFVVYADTFRSMVSVWLTSNTYLHGLLILPMSAYLIWRDREVWLSLRFKRSALGYFLLIFSVGVWLLGYVISAQVVTHFALIAMLVAVIWSMLGTDVVRAVHFPLLFAFFAVPFGDFLTPILVDWTADATVFGLRATGIPVLRDNNYFSLPSGNFRVIDACSGIRFLIVTGVLGLYFAHENFQHWKPRIIFIGVALATVIVANWFRAYFVVLLAHFSEMKFGTGQDHIFLGWFIFLVVIIGLFRAGRKFGDGDEGNLVQPVFSSMADGRLDQSVGGYADVVVPVLVLATLIAGPLAASSEIQAEADMQFGPALPTFAGGWEGPLPVEFGFEPGFSGATRTAAGQYRRGRAQVEIFIYFFSHERQGNELIGWQSQLVSGSPWYEEASGTRAIQTSGQRELKVRESLVAGGRTRLRAWYWYDVGGNSTANMGVAKAYQAWNRVIGRYYGDAVVVLIAKDPDSSGESARMELRSFIDDNLDMIEGCLRHSPQMKSGECSAAGP